MPPYTPPPIPQQPYTPPSFVPPTPPQTNYQTPSSVKPKKGYLWTALIVVLLIAVGGGYVYYKTQPTAQTQLIAQAVVPAVVPPGTPPAVQSAVQTVMGHTSQAVLNSMSQQRLQGVDQMIKQSLGYFRSLAATYLDGQNPNSYGLAVNGAAGCTTAGSMFVANQYTGNSNYKALLDPNDYPSGTQLVCNVSSGGKAYAVQISLATNGYWCIDSTGSSRAETIALGVQTKCQ